MASVLIVDDSMVMRKTLRNMLIQSGYTVVAEANDGEEAIKMYSMFQPDYVTMDLNMPNVDGLSAMKGIVMSFPHARILVISSIDQKEVVMEALKCGAKYYILKPITSDKVLDALNRISVG